MISGMWRDHEIINNFNVSLSAQQDEFQMDSFLFCRQMEVYNSSLWLWLPFPCFLAIKFWANKMEICTMGNLLTPYCICLLSRHYNLPAWWIYTLRGWNESCRYLGLIQTMCQLPMRKWQHTLTRQYNCMFQGGWISLIWGASHHTQGRDTHTVTSFTGMYVSSSHWNLEFERSWLLLQKAPTNKIWAQSKLPRRSWFIIKLWNSLLWREGGGRHYTGDILLQFTLWKVWVHAVGLPCTSWKWQFLTHCSILCRQVSWILCWRFLFFSMARSHQILRNVFWNCQIYKVGCSMLPKYSIIRMMVIFHICMVMLCIKFLVQSKNCKRKLN